VEDAATRSRTRITILAAFLFQRQGTERIGSMLSFDINRAGRNLPRIERYRLERAKAKLKRQFGRD
jgi:hypothetical protein